MELQTKELGELVTALISARMELKPIIKSDRDDLCDLLELVVPVLSKRGLFLSQATNEHDGWVVTSTLFHSSGQWMRGISHVPQKTLNKYNQLGSAINFARRYALCSLLGISEKGEEVKAADCIHRDLKSENVDARRYGQKSPGVFKRPRPDKDNQNHDGKLKLREIRDKVAKECPNITAESALASGDFAVTKEKWIGLKIKEAYDWQEAAFNLLQKTGISKMNTVDQRLALLAHDIRNERLRKKEIERQRHEEQRGQNEFF